MGIDITGLGSLFEFGAKLIDKIFPDKTQAEQAKAALALAQQQGQLQEEQAAWDNARAQLEVNKQEAASTSLFVAGWRPFIGWVCGGAFAWSFVLQPFAAFWVKVADGGFDVRALPSLDTSAMMPVLLGMLGLGGLRTVEKIRGAAPAGHA
jgi:hypothetical protein